MGTGAQASITRINDEITAVVENVESGANILYLGTTNGDVYSYNQTSGVLTKLGNMGGKIVNMCLYSSALWVALAGGELKSIETA